MSGLSMGEKDYWRKRISEILDGVEEKALEAVGTSSQGIRDEAERRLTQRAGAEDLERERETLLAQLESLKKHIEALKIEANDKWRDLGIALGGGEYRFRYNAKDAVFELFLKQIEAEVAADMGVYSVLESRSCIKKELDDAIMLATSSIKMQKFISAVLNKHGVPDTHGLRAIVEAE